MKPIFRTTLLLSAAVLQTACSSSNDNNDISGPNNVPVASPLNDEPDVSEIVMAPAGQITHYGAISVADDAGQASDLVGSFYRLESTVSADFLNGMLTGESTFCDVQSDDTIDFEEISASYVPSVPGVRGTAVSAGESLILTSPAGTFATLQEQPAAGFLFYDLPNMAMLTQGPVPDGLSVDVAGSTEIPMIAAAAVPAITTLSGASPSADTNISTGTQFTWDASGDPSAMIRIFTGTAGGFFLEDGVTVTCVAPDSGSFSFPAETQALLGSDFAGGPALMSRIVVNTVQAESTVLYVIRESFR